VNGSLSYDMNTGTAATRFAGNKETSQRADWTEVSLPSRLHCEKQGRCDWLEGAKLVRQRMPSIPTHYYDDKLVYGIHCDEPKYEKRRHFQQCEKLIRDVAALTGNAAKSFIYGLAVSR